MSDLFSANPSNASAAQKKAAFSAPVPSAPSAGKGKGAGKFAGNLELVALARFDDGDFPCVEFRRSVPGSRVSDGGWQYRGDDGELLFGGQLKMSGASDDELGAAATALLHGDFNSAFAEYPHILLSCIRLGGFKIPSPLAP